MTAEEWRAVKELFSVCLGAPRESRAKLLAEANVADSIRAEAARLLENLDGAGDSFLEAPGAVRQVVQDHKAVSASFAAGKRLGPYEIVSLIGAGGMGEVYRARDNALKRDVALKVLPASFVRDPDRMARFQREAEVLASLDHPNVGPIYGIVDSEESRGLVLALIKGPTLADQIALRPLPLEDALSIAKQIIAALEYAHDRGVVHRDLKPANIKITPEGVVKVLDFGLAKILEDEQPKSSLTNVVANSPTMTLGHTRAGMILGTAAYMSPEQAIGRPVDRRSDIFSFGAVLFEMLTGKRAFTGAATPDVLEAVVKVDPDWSALPAGTPGYLRKLLERTLQKDRKERLQAIGEARIMLAKPQSDEPASATSPSRLANAMPWAIAGVITLAFAAVSFAHFREAPAQTLRFAISLPENGTIRSFAISPDSRTLVIAATVRGKRQLYLRPMDSLPFQAMPFTEDASYPFWSPDSRYIGFFAQGKLKKVAATGGPAQDLCDAPNPRGGSWSPEDVIIFSPNSSGISIQRVPATGGVPSEVTKSKGSLQYPVFLPDGHRFLYLLRGGTVEQNGIYVSSLDGKENRRLLPDVSAIALAPSSRSGLPTHILFVRQNTLMAVPLDPAGAQISGDVFPLADGVELNTSTTYTPVTVSESGVLLYEAGGVSVKSQIVWYDRTGKQLGPVGAPGAIWDPALSPDEKLAAFRRDAGTAVDLWVRDLSRGTETRLTSNSAGNVGPIWSPNGDRIIFSSNRKGGAFNLYQKAANGSGQDELLLQDSVSVIPTQWSRDGRFIVYYRADLKSKQDLWVLPIAGAAADRKPLPFVRTEFTEAYGQLSPDSHWMAFMSDRSGRHEVYVRPFPPGEGEYTISLAGGQAPRWRGDGKELFFEGADGKIMAVPVKVTLGSKPSFEAGAPTALFDAHLAQPGGTNAFEYDVTADGKRFLINTVVGSVSPPLTVVTNWQSGVKK